MKLPILYDLDKKQKVRMWEIYTVNDTIITNHGLLEGKKITTNETVKGKNIGRANETTPKQQAEKEALSKWNKRKDKNYTETIPRSSKTLKLNLSPMLAHDYKKHKNKVIPPFYVQPKLDGYRMIYDGPNDKIFSRNGKEYSILYGTKLHKDLQKHNNIILDGELYTHDSDFEFEIYGILRKKKLNKGDEKTLDRIQYHIYDTISEETFKMRLKTIQKIKETSNIKISKTEECLDIDCLYNKQEKYIKDGYEGTMIRNKEGLYSNNRSTDLLKYKDFDDAEFKVVGFEKETDTKGDGARPVVWVCVTKQGKNFKVPSKGTREERTKLYDTGQKYIGKQLTVQFFGYSKDGIPRFPKTFRSGGSSFKK